MTPGLVMETFSMINKFKMFVMYNNDAGSLKIHIQITVSSYIIIELRTTVFIYYVNCFHDHPHRSPRTFYFRFTLNILF